MSQFTKPFDKFACVGDTIRCTVAGIDYTARLEFDSDTKVSEYDCYSEEDVRRWENDEWHFGGIVLSASAGGLSLNDHLASLWGIDVDNSSPESSVYLTEVANELLPEAIACALARLEEVKATLAALPAQA